VPAGKNDKSLSVQCVAIESAVTDEGSLNMQCVARVYADSKCLRTTDLHILF
jgi:hypothetical protein